MGLVRRPGTAADVRAAADFRAAPTVASPDPKHAAGTSADVRAAGHVLRSPRSPDIIPNNEFRWQEGQAESIGEHAQQVRLADRDH